MRRIGSGRLMRTWRVSPRASPHRHHRWRPRYAAVAEPGRYCCQTCGIVGVARWMKSTGAGGRGGRCRCSPESSSSRSPLRRLHGAHAVTTFSQIDSPPFERGIDVVERQPARGRAAVDAAPAVTGEERAARDLALDRARHPDVLDEPDHVRPDVGVASRSAGPWGGSRAPPPSPSRRARAPAAPNRRSAARSLHSGRVPVATLFKPSARSGIHRADSRPREDPEGAASRLGSL